MRKSWIIALLVALWAPAVLARDTITWVIFDWPPVFILQDRSSESVQQLGDGIGDHLVKLLIQRLPQYQHRVVVMTPKRAFAQMKQGENLCVPSTLRTPERENVAVFTPALITMPIQLVTREDLLQTHPDWRDGVDLETLAADRTLVGGYEGTRSYGATIDKVLADPANTGLRPVSGGEPGSLYQMLALKRIDYTLEYPQIVTWLAERKQLPAGITVVPLRQPDPWLLGNVACTKSVWGGKAIHQIDEALREAARQPSYRDLMTRWAPVHLRDAQRRELDRFLHDRSTHNYVP
ncbi:uncharacterized protein (TIGR02285 family) [Silvimonas terrae]|uniref:Uncharacterized protein (TIGR02285 family) n=1 Tax=Silvimonas terrae TaxID=300266 RepID=A0A840RKB8_9NEIS|nr:TIGR02285 family protein [Silvimonas terrae]MBB5193587.1 uncharacterized protein (TIGR02285 family) [Silvimonas terrae]